MKCRKVGKSQLCHRLNTEMRYISFALIKGLLEIVLGLVEQIEKLAQT